MFSDYYDGYALCFVESLFDSLKLIKVYIHGNCFFLKYYLRKWKMILNHHPELNKEIYNQVMYTLEETEADKLYLGAVIFESFEDDLYYEKLEIAKRYKEKYEICSRYYHQLHYKS